jgi:hypothetical protein
MMITPPEVGFAPPNKANRAAWLKGFNKYGDSVLKVAAEVRDIMGTNAQEDMVGSLGVTQDVMKRAYGIDIAAGYRIYPNLLSYYQQLVQLYNAVRGGSVDGLPKGWREKLTAGMNLAGGEGDFRGTGNIKQDLANFTPDKKGKFGPATTYTKKTKQKVYNKKTGRWEWQEVGNRLQFSGAGQDKTDARHTRMDALIQDLIARGIIRMATGGSVPGSSEDTVPAMLTPGEFVMSRQAVAKHGVGYMKNLNRGRIPGFNRGGLVGRGAVQYKQNGGTVGNGGGVLSLDPTRVQGVMDAFNANFSATLDKLAGPLSGLNDSFASLAASFSNLTMTHEFSGEIGMSVNISNKDAIVAAVTEGLTPHVTTLITEQINAAIASLKDGV